MPSDVFLKVDGVEGESSDAKHKSEIEVLSFSWGVTQAITGTVPPGTFSGQRADLSPLGHPEAVRQGVAQGRPGLRRRRPFASAVLTLCRAGGDKQPYMEYKLSDVMISSVQVGGAGEGGVPTESWSLHYAKIEMSTRRSALDGKPAGKGASGGWDLKENKKV